MGRALDAAMVNSGNTGSTGPEDVLHSISSTTQLSSNALTYAKLLTLETGLDPAYRNLPGAGFVMHDNMWQAIRSMTDSTGRPLFPNMLADLQQGVQKRLLRIPGFHFQ
jgi:HK97 family phage major capsid protein